MGLTAAAALLPKSNPGFRQRLFWFGLPTLSVIGLGLLWTAGKTSAWWTIPTPALIISFILLFLALLRLWQMFPDAPLVIERPIWGLIWLAASLTLLVVIKNTLSTPQYQGRFFFPALGPSSLLITAGWYTLLPRRIGPYLPQLLMILFVFINLYVWFNQVIPIYYQPFLD
jgi:hypothetical protein